ncbi:hypothetical protein [Baekduia sp. Peel2402]|uniref:hypothetical protein n=1 Tax=Baekduia sp. Peel2402 TaxID=3458296 RepID=UPI00403EEC52
MSLRRGAAALVSALVLAASGGAVVAAAEAEAATVSTTSSNWAGFTAAKAVTTSGHTGTITDDAWTTVAITLRSRARGGPGVLRSREDFGNAASGGAAPGALDETGSAFDVAFG